MTSNSSTMEENERRVLTASFLIFSSVLMPIDAVTFSFVLPVAGRPGLRVGAGSFIDEVRACGYRGIKSVFLPLLQQKRTKLDYFRKLFDLACVLLYCGCANLTPMNTTINKGGRPKKSPAEKRVKINAMVSPAVLDEARAYAETNSDSISRMLERGLKMVLEKWEPEKRNLK